MTVLTAANQLTLLRLILVPVFALVQAVLILGEQPAPFEIVGGGIILLGVRVATLRFVPRSPLEETEPA